MNCQSACSKAIPLRDHIQDMGYDFVGLTETWLSPEDAHAATIATLSSDGDKLYNKARRNEKGVELLCVGTPTILNCYQNTTFLPLK